MQTEHEARWVTRPRSEALKRSGALGEAILLDTYNGSILVGLAGSGLADGPALSREEADYELQDAWHYGPKAKLRAARNHLGLEASALAASATFSV
jgi:hypothetical protein